MTASGFWDIVDGVHGKAEGDMETKCELLHKQLDALSPEEVKSFDDHFNDCMIASYRWDLWGAAYIILGGCSDDAFMDFRSSLISMGRATFERVVASPGDLVDLDLDEDDLFYEGYQYVAEEVYEEKTGEMMPDEGSAEHPDEPAGAEWDEESVAELYPALAEKHGY